MVEEDRVQEHAGHLRERRARQLRRALVRARPPRRPPRARARRPRGSSARRSQSSRVAPRRIAGLSGVTRRSPPSPNQRSPACDATRTGGNTIGIADDASTWRCVSVTGSTSRRLFCQTGWPRAPFDEGEGAPRVVAGGAHRDGVEVAAADALGDAARREGALERVRERRGVEQPVGARAAEQAAEREVEGQPRAACARASRGRCGRRRRRAASTRRARSRAWPRRSARRAPRAGCR